MAFSHTQLPQESEEQKLDRMSWWSEARFGMFIHWGLYAQGARHEWLKRYERKTDEDYQRYFEIFDPDLYDPVEWARKAREAGMKYVVITSKHHEGFCLWDSEFTAYKATNTPYGKDLLQSFVKAFRDAGLRVGFYYSVIDWHHPDNRVDRLHPRWEDKDYVARNQDRDQKKYQAYIKNQVRELLTQFGRIDELWLDFSYPGPDGKDREDWDSVNLLKMVRELHPHILVNNRLDLNDVPGGFDFATPEQYSPRDWVRQDGNIVPWETCQTFSGSWGYHRDEGTWKSVHQLITLLIDTVSKGGNLLLNVGPTARGTFDDRANIRLEGIGRWMRYHDRSIYGCTQAPPGFKVPKNCLLTYNPENKRIYIHVLEWPIQALFLDGWEGKIRYAQLLNDASELLFRPARERELTAEQIEGGEGTIVMTLPVHKPSVEVPVIEIYLK
ncbi:MAG: alpha-L-fucosidase [Candidatus Aminicenantaceae bacterium]